ncbi:tricalbin [Pseudozyma hubeiensis SY62]|uniref:Tricalbin n=1 Tax=Pseudozyma hubeiensis (strain SY62) TaxID=1305764 RepID=R9P4A2_PSEHS|nr:tricalbin [Pseudozyma hubeiensis SY62]GAC92905.1 tricalbin [Pseudozyma hubeiensis SY62]
MLLSIATFAMFNDCLSDSREALDWQSKSQELADLKPGTRGKSRGHSGIDTEEAKKQRQRGAAQGRAYHACTGKLGRIGPRRSASDSS